MAPMRPTTRGQTRVRNTRSRCLMHTYNIRAHRLSGKHVNDRQWKYFRHGITNQMSKVQDRLPNRAQRSNTYVPQIRVEHQDALLAVNTSTRSTSINYVGTFQNNRQRSRSLCTIAQHSTTECIQKLSDVEPRGC